jgi:hypothetical protein
LFPVRESFVSDIPAGDGNIANLLLQYRKLGKLFMLQLKPPFSYSLELSAVAVYTDTKENQIFFIHQEIQMGSVAKSSRI